MSFKCPRCGTEPDLIQRGEKAKGNPVVAGRCPNQECDIIFFNDDGNFLERPKVA